MVVERRARDSNPHRLAPGGFQDRCNTIMRALPIRTRGKYNPETRRGKEAASVKVKLRAALTLHCQECRIQ